MSDNYLKLIPFDMNFVPDERSHQEAINYLEQLTPGGGEVEIEVYSKVTFIDQGQNLEEIICPSCEASLKNDPFSEEESDCEKLFCQIDEQSENGELEESLIKMPCCNAAVKTTDLEFKWPAGFSKFELSALNPDIEPLSKEQIAALSKILGCELREIWAHY
ncbi:hypothetical protein [Marinomonas sp. THO17]|uniref:hypothetical protein n=1 Tax=Marinomonas sp. THO17 TaxID=3149048 RepID=UPI00336C0F47